MRSFTGLAMARVRAGLLATIALLLAAPGARADTVQYSANFSFTHTGTVSSGLVSVGGTFNNSVVTSPAAYPLAQFNPALGTLTGVSVTVTTSTATFAVSSTGVLSLVSGASATRTLAYLITAGTTTGSGNNAVSSSGPQLVSLLGLGTQEIGGAPIAATKPYSLAADLAQFTGTGTMNVKLTATDALSVTTTVSLLNGAGFNGSGTYAGTVAVTYTYTPSQTVSGYVYADANHNAAMDAGEVGTGQAFYVKIATYSGGTCQAPALAAVAASPSTGAYSLGSIVAGNYCLILDNNGTLGDVTPTPIAGLIATETPTGIRLVTVGSTAVTAQNFGQYAGSSVTGSVFTDNGAGGGTANDGIQNGGEAALAGATVNALSGSTTLATATTDAAGAYTLWLPSTTSGTVSIVQPIAGGRLATGGSAGTTGGTFSRALDATAFTFASGNGYSGVNFGGVPVNTFVADNAQTVGPGAVVPYAHTFVAGSAGQLTLTTGAVSTPSAAWTQSVILDANCNGVVDAGETAVAGAIAVTAGQTVCIVVRDTSPAASGNGANDVVTVTATFAYTNASPALTATLAHTDTTTVSTAILLQLGTQVRNVTQATGFTTADNAKPNDVLEYRITTTNPASTGVSTLIMADTMPTWTTFVSASCPGSLPSGVTACTITQPAVGATGTVQWTFAGTLAASGSLAVTYQVRVNP